MNLYLDSSSFLKLFIAEPQSATMRNLLETAHGLTTSVIAWPEGRGGLARAERSGRISPEYHAEAITQLTEFLTSATVIDMTVGVARVAGDLAARYFLRGLDAIHLASALTLQEGLGEAVSFSSFDSRLNEAAADCGLAVV